MANTTSSMVHSVEIPAQSEQIIEKDRGGGQTGHHNDPNGTAEFIHRTADFIKDHKTYHGQNQGAGGRYIRLIHLEGIAENIQGAYDEEVGQPCWKSFNQYIGQKMAFNPLFIGFHGQEERRRADGK